MVCFSFVLSVYLCFVLTFQEELFLSDISYLSISVVLLPTGLQDLDVRFSDLQCIGPPEPF